MNIAVILAGGTGKRMGLDEPKQFLEIAGRTVLEHSVEAFERNSAIDAVLVVSHADYMDRVRNLVKRNAWRKIRGVIEGGAQRYDSSLAAVKFFEGTENTATLNLIFHDAARPWVSQAVIDRVVQALKEHRAVAVAIPSTDTVLETENGFIRNIPDRRHMFLAQTPQAFRFELIRRAYELAVQDPDLQATDDCGIVKRYLPEETVYVVQGETNNRKITYKEDI